MLCRAQSLQSARAAYDDYRSGYNHVLQFLSNIPSYEPQETDSLSQMETKLKNQKVRQLLLRSWAHSHKGQGLRGQSQPFGGGEPGSGCHLPWQSCDLTGPWPCLAPST